MKTLVIQHYVIDDADCIPQSETWQTLSCLCNDMAPKIGSLEIQLVLRQVGITDTEENRKLGNLVTFSSPESDSPETSLESVLGIEVDYTSYGHDTCRTLVMPEEIRFMSVPSGMLLDGILRYAFTLMGDGCGGGCSGCCSSCHG